MARISIDKETTKEVTETETVHKIKCDVCDYLYDEDDDMEIHTFSIDLNKTLSRFMSLHDLERAVTAHYRKIPVEEIEADEEYNIPTVRLTHALTKELELINTEADPYVNDIWDRTSNRKELEEKLDDERFYLKDGFIFHFMYELSNEWEREKTKHVCDDCYEVVF